MPHEQLVSFLSGLQATINSNKDFQKLYNHSFAFEFNALNLFKVDENRLSLLLKYFLNPYAGHGQGDIFLLDFLKHFDLEHNVANAYSIKAYCEYTTDTNRRLDVYLNFVEDEFGIGIENKIGAADQDNQLKDYSTFLDKRHNGNYCLFYLTHNDVLPRDNSISTEEYKTLNKNGQLIQISYTNHIIPLLSTWIKSCEADRVRYFLKEMQQYFKQRFNGEQFMNEHNIIADYIVKNSTSVETAFDVSNAMTEIKNKLNLELMKQLEEIAKNNNLTFSHNYKLHGCSYRGFYFDHKDLEIDNQRIRFEFGREWGSDLYFGICKKVSSLKLAQK